MPSIMVTKVLNLCSLCIAALFVGLSEAPAAPQMLQSFGTIHPASIEAWNSFRIAQPFQTQVIALSEPNKAQPRTLIVSEPPPQVSWDHLAASLSIISRGCTVKRWIIMSGGWVQDVVCTLKSDTGRTLPDRLAILQQDIYGTTEGSAVVALPAPRRAMIAHNLDLRYNASDLHRWLYEGDQRFRASPIAEVVSLDDILKGRIRGVFLNSNRALVLWAFDRAGILTELEAEFRRFAVSSDLVLGAVASQTTVVVIGRGRVESLSHLPPLRVETVLLLAGSSQDSLRQSYERNDILSGKGFDGIDRAPILLSPQLVDTELGNLLNLTDQLLKGWSFAGLVRYVNFKYPRPMIYPFGKVPAIQAEKDKERSNFLFNWNTDGVAYRQSIKGLDVVVPQRMGALSVIYGDPQDRPRNLENTGYDYFATSGDTSLVRVVQYTLLYQIFRQFDIRATPPPISPRHEAFAVNVKDTTRRQFKLVMSDLTSENINKSLRAYWRRYAERIPDAVFSESGVSREKFVERRIKKSIEIAAALRKGQVASNGQLSDALAEITSILRHRAELTTAERASFDSALQTVESSLPHDLALIMLEENANGLRSSGIMAVAAEKLGSWASLSAASARASWNHTAYVVESRVTDPSLAAGVGGHNIDAPMVRFTDSARQARGEISVSHDASGQLVVTYNPFDSNRLRDIARQVGTRKEFAADRIEVEVNAALKSIPSDPPVPFAVIRPESKIAVHKSTDFKFLGPTESEYRIRSLNVEEQQLMSSLKATNAHAIVFEQLHNGSFVMTRTGSEEALHVASITAATDALANGLLVSAGGRDPVTVLVKGLPIDKTEAMLTQIQSSLRRYPKKTVEQVLSAERTGSLLVERPALLNARIAHNGIRVERGAVKVEQVTSGTYKGYSRVEVPVTIQAKTPLLLRFIFFVKNFTDASREFLLNKLTSVVATLKGPVSMADIHLAVRQQLQADFRDLGVDAVLLRHDSDPTGKMHDVIIAKDPSSQAHVS